ncbi:MAG TPA: hypothetical protein VMX38_00250 [Verrucomicrobiae bacterium]|nr:hypothetical protein [Verrucomicrobiae bacterium]
MDDSVTSLEGPVEKIDGKLVLRIPLDAGGRELIDCSRGISEVQGGFLCITMPEWLAGMLRIEQGCRVYVDNRHGKCNIQPVNPQLLQ